MLVARIVVLLVLFSLFCGCSPDYVKPGVFVEVHGKVWLDGAPVRGAKVVLVPEQIGIEEAFAISTGTTNAMGEFELNTADGTQGALAGKHRVYISRMSEDPGERPSKPIARADIDKTVVKSFSAIEEPGLVWELVDHSVQQPSGEEIPFYYNLKSEITYRVIPGRGIQRPTFELSSIDPMLHNRK